MCTCNRDLHARRRAAFFDAMASSAGDASDAVAVFPSAPVYTRNNDVEHDYRQDSDFFYLTGFDEPHSVLVMEGKERKATMFVRPRDPEREVWTGRRSGVEGAVARWGADQAFPIGELRTRLPELVDGAAELHYLFADDAALDELASSTVRTLWAQQRLGKRLAAML